jgi:hypothetical protein
MYEPFIRVIDHAYYLPHYFLILSIQISRNILIQEITLVGKFDPDLSFASLTFRVTQFRYEGSFIPAFSPRFGDITAY